jgi:arylsulfatase A-like enzyme
MIPKRISAAASFPFIAKVSLCLYLGGLFPPAQPAVAAAQPPPRPPNFVVVLIDNLGKDWFGCYGSDEGQTPNMDRLAATGVRFGHCYVTAMCSTTRAAFLTGRYGFRTGWQTHHDAAIYGGGNFDWTKEVTFARPLKAAGYATAITGKWQINDLYEQPDALRRHGFDEHLVWTGAMVGEGNAAQRFETAQRNNVRELESRYWDPVVFRNGEHQVVKGRFGPDLYLEYLVNFMERNRERPFLAYYATPLVHVPVVPTPHSLNKNVPEREQFAGMVRYVDHQVGQLVEALERLRLREDTIVIVTTDNGTNVKLGGRVKGKIVPGGLGKMTEPGLDVPLIVNCPARVPGGRVDDRLVDCTDFFPTLLELAGAASAGDVAIDGRSIADAITGATAQRPRRNWIFSQYASERVVRDERFKLYASGALFDVTADFLEKKNLAASTDAGVVAARRRLQAVLDELPPDARLPFEPRSQSAFRLRGKK